MKKRGFTLIELVAVLVIIAIVSLIVAPLILNTIRKVKMNANRRSIDGYGRAVEYAMANYQLKHLKYPDTLDELEIKYTGSKVECEVTRINPDHTIYLSECKVNGKSVRDDSNKDGYYHYGTLKMTNIEYVDVYGASLNKASVAYYNSHSKTTVTDYTTLTIDYDEDKEVNCNSVRINPDGTVYLTNCEVDGVSVTDTENEDGYYHYGTVVYSAVEELKSKKNASGVTVYNAEGNNIHEMYEFNHSETVQTPALTDYRYIGSDPYNYVTFNGNETWRIIGVFTVEDGNGNLEERVKLIRNESLGNKQWNSRNLNEWLGSTMQVYLNDTYILDNKANMMVSNAVWYLGGREGYFADGEMFYASERSENVFNEDRSKKWIGKIALMYPSDYIYIYALGVDYCYNNPGNCSSSNASYGWLCQSSDLEWSLTSSLEAEYLVFSLAGRIRSDNRTQSRRTRPVLYLKPNVRIKSGDGSSSNPYEFEL